MPIKQVKVSDFLNSDFKDFSIYDAFTAIPSMIDGLKPSQRKVMWTVLNNSKTYTVEQLSSLSASYTNYHHAADNLQGVIVNLAQDFKMSNNVNWLVPDGSFGSILSHKASAARYISTRLHPNWNTWFLKDDDIIIEYEYEDGEITEPTYFIPLVPTVLFNGASGIGTGFSCNILAYNPVDIIENTKLAITGKPLNPMVPWYKDYLGKITKNGTQTVFYGAFERINSTSLRITELPYGYDIDSYKDVMNKLMEEGLIKDYDNDSNSKGWNITVYGSREWVKQDDSILLEQLSLISRMTETITVWNENKRIQRFSDPNDLITHFVKWRLGKFEERRVLSIQQKEETRKVLVEKQRFIEYFIENSEHFTKLTKAEMLAELVGMGYENADKLINIRIYNLTKDEIESLKAECDAITKEIENLNNTTAKKMYLEALKGIKLKGQ